MDDASSGLSTSRPKAKMAVWYTLAMFVLSLLLLSVAGVGYTTWVDHKRARAEREADRRWCQLLNTLDEAYSTVPPATELGRKVAGAIHALRTELDC